jgi:osmoprotectant transport system substrate-binding protein
MRRVAALALAAALAAGCARKPRVIPVRIGSKNFTEQIILGEIIAQSLERLGVPVERRLNMAGTFICHHALEDGEIDTYVEYTGTALMAILKLPPTSDPKAAYETVKTEYAKRFGLKWGPPLGFDNTFAMVVRRQDAKKYGLSKISDLIRVENTFRPGFGYEFLDRADGWAGVQEAYGLDFDQKPTSLDLGLIYQALESKQVDLVAGNATDGLIDAMNLTVLSDDQHFFPPYQAAPVYRPEAAARWPELARVFSLLAGRISTAEMRKMNAEVDSRRRAAAEVAREFVSSLPLARVEGSQRVVGR